MLDGKTILFVVLILINKTMALKLDIVSPAPFKLLGEQTSLAQKWDQYVKRFDYYIKASGVTQDEQKRALLLHVSGEEVQDLFETLTDTGTTYAHAIDKLNEYFSPKKNIAFERHVFRQSKQEEDETVDNFIVRLSKLSISCDFSELQKEDMIRDQVVDCCRSTDLRKKLLAESDLTLEKVRTISRPYELSSTHAKKIAADNQTNQSQSSEINRITRQSTRNQHSRSRPQTNTDQFRRTSRSESFRGSYQGPSQPNRQRNNQRRAYTRETAECYRCGGRNHYGRECIRAKNAICRDCGWKGHFAIMCKTKVKNVNSINVSDQTGLNQNYDYECSDNFQYQDNIEEILVLGNQDATVTVNIAGKNLSILVDSGASVSAIYHTLFNQLKSSNTILEKSNAKVYPYGKTTSLDLVGKATFPVKSLNVEFHIIKDSGKPLIGHKTATELGILRIGLPDDNIASVSSETESILR